jgi:putative PIN family toxin of toxin-antitoxin system
MSYAISKAIGLVRPREKVSSPNKTSNATYVALILTKTIILETLAVLSQKFGKDKEELARVAVFLADIAQLIEPKRKVHILSDEPDNRILEGALEGKASAIVTGDRAILKLERYEGIQIVRNTWQNRSDTTLISSHEPPSLPSPLSY